MKTFGELFKEFLLEKQETELAKLKELKNKTFTTIAEQEQIQKEIKDLEFSLNTIGNIGQIHKATKAAESK